MKKDHRWLESQGVLMSILVTVLVLVGGIVEIVPLYYVRSSVPPIDGVKPYTPLELEGRDIYVREGCYNCHSQMVRPFRDETERYGPYSKAGEFVYDHPFQFGSKRTGPDLHRVGGKYPDSWHYYHMRNPREIVPGSVMPVYSWLHQNALDTSLTKRKMEVLRKLGVPYSQEEIDGAKAAIDKQAQEIAGRLTEQKVEGVQADREIIALIAYLQRLGGDIHWREAQQQ
ncbi:MAG: cytochrome-c oxidase, cbb3-type subunit II [Vulcanimicrobiota bacterium]